MTVTNTRLLARLPSLKSLLVFNVAAKHLNLVRAAEELFLTQGALSRQLKSLEEHVGVLLFERGPRGLRFTQEGELLYDFTCRAFDMLGTGLGRLTLEVERETLVVSAARSFALRCLAPQVGAFIAAHPWIDLRIDVHRYFADLESSGADISIRLGLGDWPNYHVLQLTDDVLFPVCTPQLAEAVSAADPGGATRGFTLLRNLEREYWEEWNQEGRRPLNALAGPVLSFNDSATMIATIEAGMGMAITRSCLVADALARGTLVRPYAGQVCDGLDYYAVCSLRSAEKPAAMLFLHWLRQTIAPSVPTPGADQIN